MTATRHLRIVRDDERAPAPDTDWREQAACADNEITHRAWLYPFAKNLEAARDVCSACPVQAQCLDEAVNDGDASGVWGGARFILGRRVDLAANVVPLTEAA